MSLPRPVDDCFCGTLRNGCELQCLADDLPDVNGDITDVGQLSAWPHDLYKVLRWQSSSDDPEPGNHLKVADLGIADVIASQIEGSDLHTIMLDLDVPARLVPSTTPGHSHLYVDVPNDWETYCRLLTALVDAGVIEEGYAAASKARGYTALRLPWVRKEDPADG